MKKELVGIIIIITLGSMAFAGCTGEDETSKIPYAQEGDIELQIDINSEEFIISNETDAQIFILLKNIKPNSIMLTNQYSSSVELHMIFNGSEYVMLRIAVMPAEVYDIEIKPGKSVNFTLFISGAGIVLSFISGNFTSVSLAISSKYITPSASSSFILFTSSHSSY